MRVSIVAGAMLAAGLLGSVAVVAATKPSPRVERGEYLATIMDCTGCHTTGALLGQPDPQRFLAGSTVGFQIPELGIVYPANLTPDHDTGLGSWSERDIVNAVRTGVRPDGRVLVPVMPYHSYSRLTDSDAGALASYLKSLPAIRHQVPANTGASEKPTTPYLTVAMPE
ncbi:c-type cytochrome [Thalassobaculum sp.]|uniref:c-type cytochrome n=1 Tax=Thalassobaculum sp. TaxID=2022740 RepID=UPI0032EE39D9